MYSTYIHNPHIRSRLQRSLLHDRQERLREQERADMAIAQQGQAGQQKRDTMQCKALAHLMTILSEMLSAVLPYSLKILVQNVTRIHHRKRKLGIDALGSIIDFARARKGSLVGQNI
jgi:hypothetical protein